MLINILQDNNTQPRLKLMIKHFLITLTLFVGAQSFSVIASDYDETSFTTAEGVDIDLRIFHSHGSSSDHPLIFGLACDAGHGVNEEKTAEVLSDDGYEVWMPDILGSYMLPKLKSSVQSLPDSHIVELVTEAKKQSRKPVYVIASGSDVAYLLRGLSHLDSTQVAGAILLFPRLMKNKPEPGVEPEYVDAVGKTTIPLLILEGERTPNRWGLNHLKQKLAAGGSPVYSKVVPNIRGYFYQRENKNAPKELVTKQLPGLIKASIYYLEMKKQ